MTKPQCPAAQSADTTCAEAAADAPNVARSTLAGGNISTFCGPNGRPPINPAPAGPADEPRVLLCTSNPAEADLLAKQLHSRGILVSVKHIQISESFTQSAPRQYKLIVLSRDIESAKAYVKQVRDASVRTPPAQMDEEKA